MYDAFPFAFAPEVARWNRVFLVRPDTAQVVLDDERFVARFGRWTVDTSVHNIVATEPTGPYRVWRVAGPARLGLSDRSLTFATNADAGLCIGFDRPVAGMDPLGVLRHPALTVTVADPDGLARAIGLHRDAAGVPGGHD